MAQIETVKTATATNTDVDDGVLNPDSTAPNRTTVFVTLEFVGVNFVPDNLFDALDAQYGTVATNKVPARNSYHFVIST